MKNKIYHTVGTFSKSNRKITERDKIEITKTQIHDRSLSLLQLHVVNNYVESCRPIITTVESNEKSTGDNHFIRVGITTEEHETGSSYTW
jgi:hypothetical protein